MITPTPLGEDHYDLPVSFPRSCSSPRWENLPSGHQRYLLLGLNLGNMYWGQKHFSKKIEMYQYMQKKVVNVLMVFSGLRVRNRYPNLMDFSREVIL